MHHGTDEEQSAQPGTDYGGQVQEQEQAGMASDDQAIVRRFDRFGALPDERFRQCKWSGLSSEVGEVWMKPGPCSGQVKHAQASSLLWMDGLTWYNYGGEDMDDCKKRQVDG